MKGKDLGLLRTVILQYVCILFAETGDKIAVPFLNFKSSLPFFH